MPKAAKSKVEKELEENNELKKNKLALAKAMTEKPRFFKVGSGLGGYDVSLGFSYRYALEIALDVLSGIKTDDKEKLYNEVYDIFAKWRDEHGVYPPKGGLFGILLGYVSNEEPQPYKKYIKKQALVAALAPDQKIEIVHRKPWECGEYVRTPVGLYFKLLSEGYKPLMEYIEKGSYDIYDKILAILIIMTHDPDTEYQSSDCIHAAMQLAKSRMVRQKSMIKIMLPDAEAAFTRRRTLRLSNQARKEETERKVIGLHKKFEEKGENPPYKEYSAILTEGMSEDERKKSGFSKENISKILTRNGMGRYKKEK